jgi:hypothetical protein
MNNKENSGGNTEQKEHHTVDGRFDARKSRTDHSKHCDPHLENAPKIEKDNKL